MKNRLLFTAILVLFSAFSAITSFAKGTLDFLDTSDAENTHIGGTATFTPGTKTIKINYNWAYDDITFAPAISSVSVPSDATYYAAGQLDFTVNTSENITVNTTGGTPQISLTVGAATRQAVYISGSGTSALLFRYIVQSGDLDEDGISMGTLVLNGGTLKNGSGDDMALDLNGVGSLAGINVDGRAPSTQASAISFSTTTATATAISWTNGSGAKRAVFVKSGTATFQAPIDNTTYTANTAFQSGTQIGATGWYCVYNGTGTSVSITGLSANTAYSVQVVDYDGSAGAEAYSSATGATNPNTVTTLYAKPTSQAGFSAPSNITTTAARLNFSAGNGSNRVIFVLAGTTGSPSPADLTTYTASTTFGSGTQIGSTGWYCVYNGNGSTQVNITGLTLGTTYRIAVLDYNGTAGKEQYLTSAGSNTPNVFSTVATPATQASNINFTSTTSIGTTINWTSGSGSTRVVFVYQGTNGSMPGVSDGNTYTANTSYGSGSSLSSWYCVYNGTGSSVTISNLQPNTTYTAAVLEYNTVGTTQYKTSTATNNPKELTTTTPSINSTGTLSVLSTYSGTASSSISFSVSGSNMAAGIHVIPPSGFEVSSDNTTFLSDITVGSSGTISSTTVYIRLAAATAAGTYSGNVGLYSTGATTVNVATVSSVVSPIPPPTITSFTPASGPSGTLVTITGVNMGSPTALTIGGTNAIIISQTATTLVGMVMPGAATGRISVTTASGNNTSGSSFTVTTTQAPNAQQGNKLVGTGNTGNAQQGYSVSVSADGNTAIVGSFYDNSQQGAAWVYIRSAGIWVQQGNKLVGTGTIGSYVRFGNSVSVSADGNTAVIGAPENNSGEGGIWVYTRTAGVWTQQGSKLLGTGSTVANILQGYSVAISADGNTIIAGGYRDDSFVGAAWIFTRSDGVWTQQGSKLVGTGNTGTSSQGFSVSISADGNTAIVGGYTDNAHEGAAWVYTRTAGTWTQQGSKLVGTHNTGTYNQGYSVSISGDGNTAIVGGYTGDSAQGAAWVYTRTAGTWTQQGDKLVGTGNIGAAQQGTSVSLSADGNTAIVGGPADNSNVGATWIYTRSGSTWTQHGNKRVSTDNTGAAYQGTSVSISADGSTALTGGIGDNSAMGAAWVFTYVAPPPVITSFTPASGAAGTESITITGTGFNTSPTNNIVFFGGVSAIPSAASATSLTVTVPIGARYAEITVINTGTGLAATSIKPFTPTLLDLKRSFASSDFSSSTQTTLTSPNGTAIGDIDGDGKADIVVGHSVSNKISVFRNISTSGSVGFDARVDLTVQTIPDGVSLADVDGDGKLDVLVANGGSNSVSILRNTTSGSTISFAAAVNVATGTRPFILAARDLDGDGRADIVTSNSTAGSVSVLRNTSAVGSVSFAASANTNTGSGASDMVLADIDGDAKVDIVVANQTANTVSTLRNTSSVGSISFAAKQDQTGLSGAVSVVVGDIDGDGKADLATANYSGNNMSVFLNNGSSGTISFAAKTNFTTGNGPGYLSLGDLDGDGKPDLLVADYDANTISLFRNKSTSGNLLLDTRVSVSTGAGSNPIFILTGDVDGDGKSDIVSTYFTTAKLAVFQNNLGSTDANLSALTLGVGTLSPAFAVGTTSYAATVGNATSGMTITPTVKQVNATVQVQVNGGGYIAVTSGSPSSVLNLNPGSNPIDVKVTAQDGTTIKTYTVDVIRAQSTDAKLSALTLSNGTLSPVFAGATTSYTASVSNATTSITVTPTRSEGTATIKVNTVTVASGQASAAITLNTGINIIDAIVTAGDGTTTKTYTITVTRAASSISTNANLSALALSSGTLNTTFVSATTAYTMSVPYSTAALTLTPTVDQANATVKVNGTTVSSGSASGAVALNLGANTITTVVTAQDGSTLQTYTITVTRAAAATITNLSALSVSAGTISPAFAPATTAYTLFVANAVSSTTVTATRDNAGATIKVNGTTVQSQTPSGAVALTVGANMITVLVTAEDGTTTKTYTVKITRLAADQVLADQTGNATVNDTQKEVIVTSTTQPVTVTVVAGTTTIPSVDYSNVVSGGTGTVPQTTINSPLAKVEIPAATTVAGTNSTWTGTISAPKVSEYEFPKVKGQTVTKGLVIEVGDQNVSLTFTKAVRLVLYGQAGMRVARVHAGVYEEITTVGTADTQAAGDALAADQSFKVNVGADLVVWTKGFSQFITFTQSVNLEEAAAAADAASITPASIVGTGGTPSAITGPLSLPTSGAGGSIITWSSNQTNIISNDGRTVNRPVFGSGNATVVITGTVTKGTSVETVTITLTVLEAPNAAPTLTAVANQLLCYTSTAQSIALSGVTAGPESGQTTTLSLTSDKATMFNSLNISNGILNYTLAAGASGTANITVTVKDNGGTANGGTDTFTSTFTITVNPLPAIAISSSTGTILSKGLTANLTASGGTSYSWTTAAGIISGQNTPTLTVRPASTTTYTVTVTNSTGCASVQSFTLNVEEDYKALDMNNIMTPNGDGKNDLFIIKNLDMYPNNTLKVFDRAGRIVYQKQNYTNDWNGTLNAAPLDEGTYFYVLDFGSGKGLLKGYITVVR